LLRRRATHEEIMIDLYNNETNALIGSITEPELDLLIESFEEETSDDQDYWITADTIEMIADGRATDHLLKILREALGDSEGVEVRWQER
jgi:hypothetical protein